jgi:hypothetical protein
MASSIGVMSACRIAITANRDFLPNLLSRPSCMASANSDMSPDGRAVIDSGWQEIKYCLASGPPEQCIKNRTVAEIRREESADPYGREGREPKKAAILAEDAGLHSRQNELDRLPRLRKKSDRG